MTSASRPDHYHLDSAFWSHLELSAKHRALYTKAIFAWWWAMSSDRPDLQGVFRFRGGEKVSCVSTEATAQDTRVRFPKCALGRSFLPQMASHYYRKKSKQFSVAHRALWDHSLPPAVPLSRGLFPQISQ